MKVCFPVQTDQGLTSPVYGHFGSAPAFLVVDNDDGTMSLIPNNNAVHAHGQCNPVAALGGADVDAIVVGGIGRGARTRLEAMGINVLQAAAVSVDENLSLLREGKLSTMNQDCTHGEHGCH